MDTETLDLQAMSGACRCCRSKDCYKDIDTEYLWMGKREVYVEMLSETFNLTISILKSDKANSSRGLICDICILKLREATEFKHQVLESENTLNKYLDFATSSGNRHDTVEKQVSIKTEVKLEITNDDEDNFVYEFLNNDCDIDDKERLLESYEDDSIIADVRSDKLMTKRAGVSKRQRRTKIRKSDEYDECHSLCRNRIGPFICDLCQKQFKRKNILKLHIIYVCSVRRRDRGGRRRASPSLSSRPSSGDRPYHCDICNKSFKQVVNLRQHILIHTGEKPHKCEVCKKRFNQSSSLRRHMLIHTGEKHHRCDVCYKDFRQLAELRYHSLIHTGEKPHRCSICEARFAHPSNLRHHMNFHEERKRRECDICQKYFAKASALRAHKRKHTKENLQM